MEDLAVHLMAAWAKSNKAALARNHTKPKGFTESQLDVSAMLGFCAGSSDVLANGSLGQVRVARSASR